jgi:hypothetical protein
MYTTKSSMRSSQKQAQREYQERELMAYSVKNTFARKLQINKYSSNTNE